MADSSSSSRGSNEHAASIDLLTIVGNRPQFIKMGPVSAELATRGYREFTVHTGQHFDANMSQVFFDDFGIPEPDIRLNLEGRSHGRMTGEMLVALEQIMIERQPPFVLIYGDTNSTLAGALAAVKLLIPIVHIEAGPRIYDIDSPEEINRLVADNAARLRFCPDEISVENLGKENITSGVHFTGDVMYDAFVKYSRVAQERTTIVDDLGLRGERYGLMTAHRPNNTDHPDALERLVTVLERSPLPIVFAVHPRTQAALERAGLWERIRAAAHAKVIPAVGYLDILSLLSTAEIVLTDSGGMQKEAFFAGKPCVTLFFTTPWPQIESCGWLRCCWKDDGIDVEELLSAIASFRPETARPSLFGDGHAARRIADTLEEQRWLKKR